MNLWLGLMSGTSMDGIDAVLASFDGGRIQLHGTHTLDYPTETRQRLYNLSQNHGTPDDFGELDHTVGSLFAITANQLLEKAGVPHTDVAAIGSHGQTLRHQPRGPASFSLQIGDPNIIVEKTGITTVADFRRRDLAAGGQGAPLVPAFHRRFFASPDQDRCILNLGGIANISWLPKDTHDPLIGFDTGPANALMDVWCLDQTGRTMDEDGHWAEEGSVDDELLEDMLSDGYFSRSPPKSTGKEKFNLDWIRTFAQRHPDTSAEDIQRTLLELTVISIARQIPPAQDMKIYVCGGGVRNKVLMEELEKRCSPTSIRPTSDLGLDPQWVEPTAFAWLAKQTLEKKPGNVPEVTGSAGDRILGGIFQA